MELMKELYHIQVYAMRAFMVRDRFTSKGIEAYIADGGIHLHIRDDGIALPIALELVKELDVKLEKGMLPNTQKQFNAGFIKMMEKQNV